MVLYRSLRVFDFGLPILEFNENTNFSISQSSAEGAGLDKKRTRRVISPVSSLVPTLTLARISNIFKENLAFTGA